MPGPKGLGVLDFQDAVYGPITYDIASLMRDAFLSWEEDFCLDITVRYWEQARRASLPVGEDFGEYRQWLENKGVDTALMKVIPGVYTASFFATTDQMNAQIASFFRQGLV